VSIRGGRALSTRRRIYLLRHAEVASFDQHGQPVLPDEVPLTGAGRRQAERTGAALAGVRFDRVLTSGLPRTVETARLVLDAASTAPVPVPVEQWPELRELVPGRLADLAPEELEAAFVGAFAGVLPGPARFLATPWDPAYLAGRSTTMEELWAQYRGRGRLDRWWPPPGG
jgi:broad specificity phosphatase PhoE